jgi:hypothetical protein
MAKEKFDGISKIDSLISGYDTTNVEQSERVKNGEKKKQTPYVQKSYYITNKLNKAIALRAVEDDSDKSAVVRAALYQYLNLEE